MDEGIPFLRIWQLDKAGGETVYLLRENRHVARVKQFGPNSL